MLDTRKISLDKFKKTLKLAKEELLGRFQDDFREENYYTEKEIEERYNEFVEVLENNPNLMEKVSNSFEYGQVRQLEELSPHLEHGFVDKLIKKVEKKLKL